MAQTVKVSACSAGDPGSIPGSGRCPGAVLLPGKFHGQGSLMGYSPCGHRVRQDWAISLIDSPQKGSVGAPQSQSGMSTDCHYCQLFVTSPVAQMVKNLPAMQEIQVQFLGGEDPLEKGMATHSSILVWEIPRTEEPGGLQPMRLQRVRRDCVANTSLSGCLCGKEGLECCSLPSCWYWAPHFLSHHQFQCNIYLNTSILPRMKSISQNSLRAPLAFWI